MQDRYRDERALDRRVFLRSGILLSGAAVAGVGLLRGAEAEKKGEEKEVEVGPPEDLMREHGVLDRLLLVYEAGLRKFDANEDFDPAVLTGTAPPRARDLADRLRSRDRRHDRRASRADLRGSDARHT